MTDSVNGTPSTLRVPKYARFLGNLNKLSKHIIKLQSETAACCSHGQLPGRSIRTHFVFACRLNRLMAVGIALSGY